MADKPAKAVKAEAYEANDAKADEADEAIVVDKPANADVADKPTSERGRQANKAAEADKAIFMTIVATDAIYIAEIDDTTNLLNGSRITFQRFKSHWQGGRTSQ